MINYFKMTNYSTVVENTFTTNSSLINNQNGFHQEKLSHYYLVTQLLLGLCGSIIFLISFISFFMRKDVKSKKKIIFTSNLIASVFIIVQSCDPAGYFNILLLFETILNRYLILFVTLIPFDMMILNFINFIFSMMLCENYSLDNLWVKKTYKCIVYCLFIVRLMIIILCYSLGMYYNDYLWILILLGIYLLCEVIIITMLIIFSININNILKNHQKTFTDKEIQITIEKNNKVFPILSPLNISHFDSSNTKTNTKTSLSLTSICVVSQNLPKIKKRVKFENMMDRNIKELSKIRKRLILLILYLCILMSLMIVFFIADVLEYADEKYTMNNCAPLRNEYKPTYNTVEFISVIILSITLWFNLK
jgi:hypothetical protein